MIRCSDCLKCNEYQEKEIQRQTNLNSNLLVGSEKSHGKKHDEDSGREKEAHKE
jgi:hypothetical protein